MKKLLIVKLSAMGDVIQALDGLSRLDWDEAELGIDWAVDERWASLPRLEPRLSEVLTVPRALLGKPWKKLHADLRCKKYDAVVDLQGLLKSYRVTRLCTGAKKYSWGPAASRDLWVGRDTMRAYESYGLDSRTRSTRLLAWAMRRMGIEAGLRTPPGNLAVPQNEVCRILCSPHAGWPTKQLGIEAWGEIFAVLRGYFPHANIELMPGVTPRERAWSKECATKGAPFQVSVARALSLSELAPDLQRSQLYIGLDSGPTHLAQKLGLTTFTFYGPSQPAHYERNPAAMAHARGTCHLDSVFDDRCDRLRHCERCSVLTSIEAGTVLGDFLKRTYPRPFDSTFHEAVR